MASTPDGATAEPGTRGYGYGPYLREVPDNPINGLNTVQIIANGGSLPAAGDDSHGWIYKPETLQFLADSPGLDDAGRKYFEY